MPGYVNVSSSMLPNLEPIIGVAFALCLAYIALPRFRYRKDIRQFVNDQMGDLVNPDDDIKEMEIYKSVARLGSIGENDRRIFRKSTKIGDFHGFWSFIYESFFECNQDRIAVCVGAFICALLLILGVCHDTHTFTWGYEAFLQSNISVWILLVMLLQAMPVIFVASGWYMTKGAREFAMKKISDIKKAEAAKAKSASAPNKKTSASS